MNPGYTTALNHEILELGCCAPHIVYNSIQYAA
jgi:hypothetical protein